jgi:hypothetical protein
MQQEDKKKEEEERRRRYDGVWLYLGILIALALFIGLGILEGGPANGVALVLVDNATQPQQQGANWTTVDFDLTLLIKGGQWLHSDGGTNSSDVLALSGGKFRFFVGIHPELVELDNVTTCVLEGEECGSDMDCCQEGGPLVCLFSECTVA